MHTLKLKNDYRSDIDGLRAVAVLSVLFFHLEIPKFDGGFVGVDVFFVVSGFLITRIIKQEIDTKGSFNFKNFYLRRIRRLFPALFFTLLLTTTVSLLLLSPAHLQRFGGALSSAVVSVSNIYFWFEADYFDISAKLKPLLHTWSLSIEEQFYLIWPVTLLLLIKLKNKWMPPLFLFFAACLSLYANVGFSDASFDLIGRYSTILADRVADGRSTIFFLMPFRVFEFCIGGLLVWILPFSFKSKIIYNILFSFGLGLIVCSVISFDDKMLFPSYFALVPSLGTAFVIYSGSKSSFSPLLTNKFTVNIGLISYSLYLLHWPLIVFWLYVRGELTSTDKAFLTAISIFFGYLSYRYVELPFRNKEINLSHRVWKVASITAVFFLATIGIHMNQNSGWPWRVASTYLLEAGNSSEFHKKYYGGTGYPKNGPVNTKEPADIILIGDSHARHYVEGVYKEWAEPEGKALYVTEGLSCLRLPGFTRTTGRHYSSKNAEVLSLALKFLYDAKRAGKYPLVILSQYWDGQMKSAGLLDRQGHLRNINVEVEDIVLGIRSLKKLIGDTPLVVIGNVPTTGGYNLYDILTRPRLPFFSDFNIENYLKSTAKNELIDFNRHLFQAAQSTGEFVFLDPHDVLCDKGVCRNVDSQNRLIYSDESHLSIFGSREIIKNFMPELNKAYQFNFRQEQPI